MIYLLPTSVCRSRLAEVELFTLARWGQRGQGREQLMQEVIYWEAEGGATATAVGGAAGTFGCTPAEPRREHGRVRTWVRVRGACG